MTRALLRRTIVLAALSLLVPAAASAGGFVLHPNGFGEHSYSSWKADEGLPDSTGAKDQALYFQKDTATSTVAAGVAVIKGVEGMDTAALAPLEFWWRTDTHCGAGAPRFNVRFQPAVGNPQTLFVGCQEMAPSTSTTHEGRTFVRRTLPALPSLGRVVSLSIVFDEGNDVGRCRSPLPNGDSCAILDDILVAGHRWTSASDNGGGQEVTQSFDALDALLGEPIALALGS
jgi:hypothetical protein